MKSENKLSYPLFSNLIISLLSLNFFIFNNSRQLVSVKLNSNNLKPIYEMTTNNEIADNMTITVSQKEVMSQNSYKNYYVKPSYNSVTGMNLVNYAKNYIGLPYVSSGSSLVTGTDCSGFTRLIYLEFGIQLGRTVNSQLYSGSYVAKEDLQPGDLIFYGYNQGNSTHVAIYIGNNMIIHESNPRDGVKISSVNIMVYQTSRRLITSNIVVNQPIEENKITLDDEETNQNSENNKEELENIEEIKIDDEIENEEEQTIDIQNQNDLKDNVIDNYVEDNNSDLNPTEENTKDTQEDITQQEENLKN